MPQGDRRGWMRSPRASAEVGYLAQHNRHHQEVPPCVRGGRHYRLDRLHRERGPPVRARRSVSHTRTVTPKPRPPRACAEGGQGVVVP